jgi:hypothetical protein
MSQSALQQIYHRLMPDAIRFPFYSLRRRWMQALLRYYVTLSDKNVFQMRRRLLGLRGAYTGQRCFIMGNGPSLNRMDLRLFENDVVWGSNLCYLLFDRIQWRPKFYVAVDARVVPDNADEINVLGQKMPGSLFFYPVAFRYNRILKSAKNVYWYNQIPLSEDKLPYSMFCTNPSEFVYSVRTVTIAMLQFAVYLGFNPIYLIGCDTIYTVPKTVQYENGDLNLLISTSDDPNHFTSSYFGKDKKWHEPHVDLMIFHYEQAKKVCDEQNVKVFNATVGRNLEVFPCVNYLDLFR